MSARFDQELLLNRLLMDSRDTELDRRTNFLYRATRVYRIALALLTGLPVGIGVATAFFANAPALLKLLRLPRARIVIGVALAAMMFARGFRSTTNNSEAKRKAVSAIEALDAGMQSMTYQHRV